MAVKTKTKKSTSSRYVEAVGRRKTAVARVRVFPASKGGFLVNQKTLEQYFPTLEARYAAAAPFAVLSKSPAYRVEIRVSGGGISAQAGAIAHGLARALVKEDAARRPLLKQQQLLRRDPRMKERRKFGLKKARKAPQWSKR